MNRILTGCRLSLSGWSSCRQRVGQRGLTTTAARLADSRSPQDGTENSIDKDSEALAFSKIFGRRTLPSAEDPEQGTNDQFLARVDTAFRAPAMHHLHILATKHNTHITLSNPDRTSIISKSTGNIGFRKAARGTYDAAYQLAAFVLSQINDGVIFQQIKSLEVVLRGFGIGREAVTKVLLGAEGRRLRPKISQVTDATRLKFGGTRGKKPRRLG